MDDKASRRRKVAEHGRRLKQARSYGHQVWKFLQNQRKSLLTCILLLLLVLLLFGVFSQFQPPPPVTSAPSGETLVDYSTFVRQVNEGNVLAVMLRGNEVNGLLLKPLSQSGTLTTQTAGESSQKLAADFAAWSRYIGGNATASLTTASSAAPIDPARAVYTRVPAMGDGQLMSLLASKHVVVNSLPVAQTAGWVTLLWRFVPLLLLIVLMLIFFAARNNNSRSVRSIDDRITQIGKSRARRFERVKEATPPSSDNKKKSLAIPRSESTVKSGAARVTTDTHVTFADVAGIDEVRTELEEIVQFLRNPERFNRLGARIPRGALLI
jgi:ATP-dependent Zn protease